MRHVEETITALEYNRWTSSFDASSNIDNELTKPLSQSYQFYSWTLASAIWAAGLALVLIGLCMSRPKLLFFTYAGGALLVKMTIRITSELLWRLPGVGERARRLTKRVESKMGYSEPTGDAGTAWIVLLGAWKRNLAVPTVWSHNRSILRRAFADPMYISD